MTPVAKEQVKTTKSRIYKALRRSIITGRYRPEERLLVEVIASEFGTSVAPVRDALQMLGQEGLVTIRPRSGYFVTHMTLKELTDLLDLREILETAAVIRAARKVSDSQLTELESIHKGYTGDDPQSYDRYTDENRLFHVLLAEASGNKALSEMIGHLLDRLARFMVIRRGGQSQLHTHQAIIDALQNRDEAAAKDALMDEIDQTRVRILERVMVEESDRWTVK